MYFCQNTMIEDSNIKAKRSSLCENNIEHPTFVANVEENIYDDNYDDDYDDNYDDANDDATYDDTYDDIYVDVPHVNKNNKKKLPVNVNDEIKEEWFDEKIDESLYNNVVTSLQRLYDHGSTVAGKTVCPECNTAEFIMQDGDGVYICMQCGCTISKMSNKNAEKFDPDVNMCYNNSPSAFFSQSNLGTKMTGKVHKSLKVYDKWNSVSYKERSLYNTIKMINSICDQLGIFRRICDDAVILYKNINECKRESGARKGKTYITRGHNKKSIIAVCISVACCKYKDARSLKPLALALQLSEKKITSAKKLFIQRMLIDGMIKYPFTSSNPGDYVAYLCKTLDFLHKTELDGYPITEDALVRKIVNNIQELNICTKHTPLAIAACAIYIACKLLNIGIRKQRLEQVCSVSEVTINKTYWEIESYIDLLKRDDLVQICKERFKLQSQILTQKSKYFDTNGFEDLTRYSEAQIREKLFAITLPKPLDVVNTNTNLLLGLSLSNKPYTDDILKYYISRGNYSKITNEVLEIVNNDIIANSKSQFLQNIIVSDHKRWYKIGDSAENDTTGYGYDICKIDYLLNNPILKKLLTKNHDHFLVHDKLNPKNIPDSLKSVLKPSTSTTTDDAFTIYFD